MNENPSIDLIRARGMARDVQSIAEMNGWTLPADVLAAVDLSHAAKKAVMEIQAGPAPAEPRKRSDIMKWIKAEAARRADLDRQREVAEELANRLDLEGMRVVLEQTPMLIERLCAHFTELADKFRSVAHAAPAEVTGNTSPEDFAAFSTVTKTAEAMTRAAGFRDRLAQILGEDVARTPLWLVMDPAENASLFAVRELVTELEGVLPSTVDNWRKVCAVGASMAPREAVAKRKARYMQALWNGGMAADGGRHDKTMAEALGSSFAAGPLVAGQPHVGGGY